MRGAVGISLLILAKHKQLIDFILIREVERRERVFWLLSHN